MNQTERSGGVELDKFTVTLADGARVEAVYYGSGTLCLSSQVGCIVGCPFCASGRDGLFRNLTAGELQEQLEAARRRGHRPLRCTLSGVGDPLHNPGALLPFLEHCRRQKLPLSLTTTGSPTERLAEVLHLPHNGLMVSLHAGTAATHRKLLPNGPDYEKLFRLLAREWPRLSRTRRRKLGFNYLLLEGVNDGMVELEPLAGRLKVFPEVTLHLLFCNPVAGSVFRSPPADRFAAVHAYFSQQGCNVRRANTWRRRLEGGCGTLVAGRDTSG